MGEKSKMVDPVGGVKEGLHVAGLFAVGAGFEADGEEDQRKASGEAGLHHAALVVGLVVRALGGAGDSVIWRVVRGWPGAGGALEPYSLPVASPSM